MSPPPKAPPTRPWLWWAKLVFRLLVFAAVVGGIVYTVLNSHEKLDKHKFSLANVNYGWVAASGGVYLLGMVPWWLFWHQTLRAMGQRPTLWESFVAYFMSQLGKYMPGKALVIVIRTDYIRGPRVDTTVAVTSVFVETLTMMAVGSLLAAIILAVMLREDPKLVLISLGLMLCVGLPTVPPIFRRVVRLLQVHRANPSIDQALAGLDYKLMLTGWPGLALGWLLMGLSLWAALKAMPGTAEPLADYARVVPLLTACIAVAIVAGFLSFLPGGLGVRELVVATILLACHFDELTAAISAVLLRLSWLLAELVLSSILYLITLILRRARVAGGGA